MSNPPTGWYPDPTGRPHIVRFWDGQKWTSRTKHENELQPEPSRPEDDARSAVPQQAPQSPDQPAEPSQARPPAAQQQDWQQPSQESGGQQGTWSADPQPWTPDQFSSHNEPTTDPNQSQQSPAQQDQQQPPAQEQNWQQPPGWQDWQQQPQQPGPQQGTWSADPQPWTPDQFSSYEQPSEPSQPPAAQQQNWQQQPQSGGQQDWQQQPQQDWQQHPPQSGGQQGAWAADPQQQWSADEFTSYEQPGPDAEQTQQQPWTADQDWSQDPAAHSGAPTQQSAPDQQQSWTADQQPWAPSEFSSYEQPAPQPPTDREQEGWWPPADAVSGPSQEQADAGPAPWGNGTQQPDAGVPAPQDGQQPEIGAAPWGQSGQDGHERPPLRAVAADGTTLDSTPSTTSNTPGSTVEPTTSTADGAPVSIFGGTSDNTADGESSSAASTGSTAGDTADSSSGGTGDGGEGGWWQPVPTADLWAAAGDANGGARLRAVSPDESVPEPTVPQIVPAAAQPPQDDPAYNGQPARTATTEAAARARATWGAGELAPAPPEHWTQREIAADLALALEDGSLEAVPSELTVVPEEEPQTRWTLRLAPDPTENPADAASAQPNEPALPSTDATAEQSAMGEYDADDDGEAAALLQPDWGRQDDEQAQQSEQSDDVPAWGVEADDNAAANRADEAAPLWTVPETPTTPQEQQPVQLWGDQPSQTPPAEHPAPAALWGTQQTAPTDQQAGQAWAGQTWPVQEPTQQAAQPPTAGQQGNSGWSQAPQQQQWNAAGQQAWSEQQTQPAWGNDAQAPWGGRADLSLGVGKGDGGKGGKGGKKKSKGSGGGGSLGGAKMPLFIGGGVALVMLIVAAVVLITNGNDKTATPEPTGTPTQSTSPTNESSTKPGQSKNPALHEGANRISSDAISFPRRNPPWSDRKRLVAQLLNSNGQRIVLKEDVADQDDWSADIFVGALGTGSGFNGDPKATAASLALKVRPGMYGKIPVSFKTIANGPVKRSGKSGWVFVQTVTTTAAVTDRVLTLTVAVFDLGDGTAVAYISGIPTTRPDLKAAADQAYLGIHVG